MDVKGLWHPSAYCVLLLVMLIGIQPVAAEETRDGMQRMAEPADVPDIDNAEINTSALAPWQPTPELVTVFHAEAGDPAFPGPKHMTSGPNVIEVSFHPAVLSLLIVLGAFGIAGVCIRKIGEMDDNRR